MTIVSPSSTTAIGPPSAASGATWPIIRPWVPPENRPSVRSATESPSPSPTSAAGDLEHLLHARPADRALVADDDDVAGHDLLRTDGVVAGRLGVEHAGRAAVLAALVAGQLDDAAVRRERAVEDGQPAVRLERRLERVDDLLAGRLDDVGGDLGDRPAVDGRRVAVEEPGPLEQLAHDQRDAARLVHVERGVAAARPHVGDERGPVGDGPELVDVERDPELVGDREQMQHAVGRAAGGGHAGDPVLERLAGHDVHGRTSRRTRSMTSSPDR